jgi:GTP-binding protein
MNMIAKSKVSIVDPTPGVTRDRVATIVELDPPDGNRPRMAVEFVDTGGFGAYTAPGERFDEIGEDLNKLTGSIEYQIAQAVGNADVVLFALDAQQGITPQDELIARMLRSGEFARREAGAAKARAGEEAGEPLTKDQTKDKTKGKAKGKAEPKPKGRKAPAVPVPPVRIIANKIDGPRWEAHGHELSALGFGEPLMVSAKNNYMRRDFLDAIYELLEQEMSRHSGHAEEAPRADLLLAIVGKRNAGKSTLVNTLAGEPRMIVSEIAGTTRDAVDVRFELDGRSMIAIDTAGVRRKRSFQSMVEQYAFDRAKRSIDRADVVLLLIDATEKISQVDEQLALYIQKSFRPVIVVVNKWDVAEGEIGAKGKPVSAEDYETYLRKELKGLSFAPIAFMSGMTGLNVTETVNLAFELKAQSNSRVTTGILNRLVRKIMETNSPTDEKGTRAKVYYVAQTQVFPPTITMVVNHPELFRPNYMRFIANRFREELPFDEVPIRVVVRSRRDREDDIVRDEDATIVAPDRLSKRKGGKRKADIDLPLAEGRRQEKVVTNDEETSDDADSFFED